MEGMRRGAAMRVRITEKRGSTTCVCVCVCVCARARVSCLCVCEFVCVWAHA